MKKIFRMASLAVFGAVMAVSCTDTWDDHYENGQTSGTTTMAYLQAHASEFAEVIKAAGYEEKLSSSQMLTILAPQNGSFDKNALLQMIADGNKKEVVERFIENHLMLYPVSLNNEPKLVSLLNDKKIQFGTLADNTIEDVPVLEPNIVCSNGVVHVMQDEINYKPNVLEQIKSNYEKYLADNGLEDSNDIISLYTFLRKYDADSLDELHSVEFGQDEYGNVVYSDSVMIRNNTVLKSLKADIYTEDSAFWAIDPGVANYQKLYNEALKYFNFNIAYAESQERRDSMQRYFAQFHTIGEFFFNANTNEGDIESKTTKGDSLTTTMFNRRTWKLHNYKAPFKPKGILSNVDETQTCSNGYVFKFADGTPSTSGSETETETETESSTDTSFPISVYDAFFHDIRIETQPTTMVQPTGRNSSEEWTVDNTSTKMWYSTSNDSVTNGYMKIEGNGITGKPTVSFKLSNTYSGTYDIYIVMLPWSVFNPIYDEEGNLDTSNMIPVKFKSYLFEADENNVIPYLTNNVNVDNFTSGNDGRPNFVEYKHATMVDTVFVGTHTFNYCYEHTSSSSAYLKLALERSVAERNQGLFDNKFLIDFIYLFPHEEGVDPKSRFQDRFIQKTDEEPRFIKQRP